MIRPVALALLPLLLGGCPAGVLPGPVSQLDKLTELQSAGRSAEIAATTPVADCAAAPFGSDACPRIHAIRGRACLLQAQAEAAPGAACPPPTPTARGNIDCAVASYALASGASPPGSADAQNQSENRARALFCAAPFRPPAEATAMAQTVGQELGTLPATPPRDLLAASSALSIAQRGDMTPSARCAAARDAAAKARRGLAGAPDPNVAQALRGTVAAATSQAAALPGCTGVGA